MKADAQHFLWIGRILKDIRFWIFLFFLIRMIGIINPPLEVSHNWRQSYTNMLARNFYEVDPNILYPRIDMTEGESGITGAEFPLFNYIIYIFFKIFGLNHWMAGCINLVVSSLGIYFFFLIVRRIKGERLAFFSAMILLSSLWFVFSRKIMPDTFSVSLVMAGLWFMLRFLDYHKTRDWIFFTLLIILGTLVKIPASALLGVLIIPVLMKQYSHSIKIRIIISGLLSLGAIYLWYFYWVPHLIETYGFPLYFPRTFKEGFIEIFQYWPDTSEKFYFAALQSFAGTLAFIFGLIAAIRNKDKLMLAILLSVFALFFVFMVKAGLIFSTHDYYMIPFVPIMAYSLLMD